MLRVEIVADVIWSRRVDVGFLAEDEVAADMRALEGFGRGGRQRTGPRGQRRQEIRDYSQVPRDARIAPSHQQAHAAWSKGDPARPRRQAIYLFGRRLILTRARWVPEGGERHWWRVRNQTTVSAFTGSLHSRVVLEIAVADTTDVSDTSGRLIAASKVNGTTVYDTAGEKLGSVYDVMIDKVTGRTRSAIMSFGGILGIGDSYHPLPWEALSYDEDHKGYASTSTDPALRARQPIQGPTVTCGPTLITLAW